MREVTLATIRVVEVTLTVCRYRSPCAAFRGFIIVSAATKNKLIRAASRVEAVHIQYVHVHEKTKLKI